MRRHVRTLGHEAHVAQVALLHDFPEDALVDRGHLAGICGVDRVEQCWEGVAQAEAAATAVTDIEDALELLLERAEIIELG